MKEKLIEEFSTELSNKTLPLIIHYALKKNHPLEEDEKTQHIDGDLPFCFKRYVTKRYIPGNKFYKPISRTLNA